MVFQGRPAGTLFSEEDFDRRLAQARADIVACEEAGFCPVEGGEIAWRYHPLEGARGVVVLVHGFTEFAEKYDEMVWYLLNNGYAVFRFDLRGHGRSVRGVEDPELTHVDRFEDYVDDLDILLKGVVLPRAGDLPITLFGHSMGGAVVVKYLAGHPEVKIAKAILSSPMVCPQTHHFPRRLLMARTKTYAKRFGVKAKFPHSRPFNPAPAFENSSDTSWARFKEHIRLRCVNLCYRNSTASVGWMQAALPVKDELLRRKTTDGIACPVLIVSCGRDTVVRNGPQRKLARHLKNCRRVFLKDAKHTPFTACQPVIGDYYRTLFDFLAE